MPQRWGKPGSVTTRTHTGQLVISLHRNTWVAAGGTGGENTGSITEMTHAEFLYIEVFYTTVEDMEKCVCVCVCVTPVCF